MQIQINTDHNIKGTLEYQLETDQYEKIVLDALGHFQKNISRIDIHFSDVNAGKTGFNDKRCLLEARVSGVKSVIAVHQASELLLALDGAAEKLRNSLEKTFGKMRSH